MRLDDVASASIFRMPEPTPARPTRSPLRHGVAVRTSAEPAHGITRARLRARVVQHPFTAVSSVGLDLGDVRDLCSAYAPLLREGEAFSHLTAAALYGVPLPSTVRAGPLHVLRPSSSSRARTSGVVGHRRSRAFASRTVAGLPVVEPALAWRQLCVMLGRHDLTAAGDFLVSGQRVGFARLPALTSIDALSEALEHDGTRRGRAAAAWAIARIRVGVDSRPESLLRLMIVDAGFPEPVVNAPVAVGEGVVWHPDLAFPARRVAIEYQGAPHGDRHAWKRDTERRERFEDAGWRVLFVTSNDLFRDPGPFLRRLARALHSPALG
jgi:very-short-patch-repair endonuclease